MDISALGNAATNVQRIAGYKQPSPIPDAASKPMPAVAAVQKSAPEPSLDQVKQAVQHINESLQSLSQGLEFSVDADSKQTVVKVIDSQTREIIRQMPSEQALQIAKALDQVLGKLLSEKA